MRFPGLVFTAVFVFVSQPFLAESGDFNPISPETTESESSYNYRASCARAYSFAQLNINNIRTHIMSGGHKWVQPPLGSNKSYQIGRRSGNSPSTSIMGHGGLWLGGFDEEMNLKVAATTYRVQNRVEYWPGPLSQPDGDITADACRDWDRIFEIRLEDVEIQRRNIETYTKSGQNIPRELIPDRVKYWPGVGNPFFNEKYDFDLPGYSQGMAPFFDYRGNGIYNPEEGDFPIIGIHTCPGKMDSRVPDQMFWWVINDAGGIHTNSGGDPLYFEIQNQAFAFQSDLELDDMTFYRHRLINRGPSIIDSLYLGVFSVPTLSCYAHQNYFGSYPDLDMMYVYQNFNLSNPCICSSFQPFELEYCDQFPATAISFLDGLKDQFGNGLGMSVFMYYSNPGGFPGPSGKTDPSWALEFYRYLTGSWRDGTPLTLWGSGYSPGSSNIVSHAFPGNPAEDQWTFCTSNIQAGSRRVIMSSGPARISPGMVNDLTYAASWVPDVDYICPDLSRLFYTTKRTRELFNNCFVDENIGPDAPNLDFASFNRSFFIFLDSDFEGSNNQAHTYRERGAFFPEGVDDPYYHFEGYLVFQLRDENVEPSLENLYDPYRSRLVFQTDIENDVGDIYNWNPKRNPNPFGRRIFRPQLMVQAENAGIKTHFRLFEDAFAKGEDRRFVPGKEYYFTTIAYAHNSYKEFNWREPEIGQRFPFLPSSRNVKVYSITMAHPLDDDVGKVDKAFGEEQNIIFQTENHLGLQLIENPGREQLHFVIHGSLESFYDIEVFAMNGRPIYSGRARSGKGSIDASSWPPGIYLIRLLDFENSERVVEKWIRQ